MKKNILLSLFTMIMCLLLVGCGEDKNLNNNSNDNSNSNQTNENINKNYNNDTTDTNNKENNNSNKSNTADIDDEIIEFDDEENAPIVGETTVVEEVINCPGCVYAYFSDEGDIAKTLGSTLSPSDYTNDVTNLKTAGGKQRHNFFGLVLSGNKIQRAYACILKDNKIYCIEGSTNGAYHSSNIAILNKIFSSSQCKTISNGNTYTCTDGSYNGDTQTSGYTSMHYETSCTIYGANSNTGKLICH